MKKAFGNIDPEVVQGRKASKKKNASLLLALRWISIVEHDSCLFKRRLKRWVVFLKTDEAMCKLPDSFKEKDDALNFARLWSKALNIHIYLRR